ncbi:hypothetical protein N7493_006535 [Penicillium malachiteum]|uniref:Zn(2)-C6 fungal-type domain-containing protein n=1 Tax=Penicillium malachiteum TaxID=1324776 RepID=A0AAD6HKR4_9EURO|nr:hypothetical protein N7493_006535 [Penicillium malachiteum]
MGRTFNVRFVGGNYSTISAKETEWKKSRAMDHPNRRRKSRFACLNCKERHLKCDETFPVCLRCKQRGVNCRSTFRSSQWQIEIPGVTIGSELSNIPSPVKNHLLRYWLEKASQIMVIDPEVNPFSFEILKYLRTSQSLIYTIQSLSLAHQGFFSSASSEGVLQERAHALSLIQTELQQEAPTYGSLLAVILLGLCSAWLDNQRDLEFGKEHLMGTRAIVDILLAKPGAEKDPFLQQTVAIYLGWEQAVAFFLNANDQIVPYSEGFSRCVQEMRSQYNATIGYSSDIMLLLGNVGRYCGAIMDGAPRDIVLEGFLEHSLLQLDSASSDTQSHLVNNSFRGHGLIMLYRSIQHCPSSILLELPTEYPDECVIKQYAKDILHDISSLPANSCYHSLLSLPLLTAGAELDLVSSCERQQVRERFQNLFSSTRLPANIRAITILEEIWEMHDNGNDVFWLSYLLTTSRVLILC